MKAVVDSDVLIDYLAGLPQAIAEVETYAQPCISIISWMEVMVGAANPNEETVRRQFLTTFKLLPISMAIAARAVTLRRSKRLKLPDAIVWATALEENCLLVTRNTKDFPAGDPSIRFPYTI